MMKYRGRKLFILLASVILLIGLTTVAVSAGTVKNVSISSTDYKTVQKNSQFTIEGTVSGQGITKWNAVALDKNITIVKREMTPVAKYKWSFKVTAKASNPGKIQVRLYDSKGCIVKKKNSSIGIKKSNYYAQTTAKSGLNIRKNPVNGAVVGSYSCGTLVKVEAIFLGSDGRNWAKTSKGYVCMTYLKKVTCYKVTYNANGGKGAPTAQVAKANSTFNLRTTKPTRSGYTFLGWSTNKNATSATYKAGTSVKIKGDATLYAVWQFNERKYQCTAAAGNNVRSGAGSSYSRVGIAKKGTTFTVTKIKGSWGYTKSIKTNNGVKAGWVSLNYCKEVKGNYNVDAALKFAKGNVYKNSSWLCAEYVTRALNAGGYNLKVGNCKTVGGLVDNLKKTNTGEMVKLTVNSDGRILYTKNKGKLSVGDPIFIYCHSETDGRPYVHTVLVSDLNGSNGIKVYAHNKAYNNERYWGFKNNCGSCQNRGRHCKQTTVYAYHIDQ